MMSLSFMVVNIPALETFSFDLFYIAIKLFYSRIVLINQELKCDSALMFVEVSDGGEP